jgi:hypothetical protein
MDSRATENFIVLESIVSTKLRTLKKQVLYRFYLTNRQLAKDNRIIQYKI